MTFLLDAAIRSSALLALGLIGAAALRRYPAAFRHWLLASAVGAAALVVPLTYTLPSWNLTIAAPSAVSLPDARTTAVASEARDVVASVGIEPARTFAVTTGLWLAGLMVAGFVMLIRIVRLRRLSACAAPIDDSRWLAAVRRVSARYGINRPVSLLQTATPDLLATWGARRPRVLLPAGAAHWTDDRIHVVLCHELAHVRRHDWAVQLAADIVRIVYWFNPLMWIVCMRLRRESEHACDDVVLRTGVAAPDYAAHLLELARMSRPGPPWVPAVPMARRSTLERRIAAMLNTAINRGTLSRRAVLVTAALLVCALLPIAALRATQSGPLPLNGTIYDTSGAVLPGVEVTLQDAQEFKWQATTDASGHFEFPPVQPGRYVLEASLMGFKALRNEFTLKDARDWDRPVTMQIGELTETITVTTARSARSMQAAQAQPMRVRVGGNIKAPLKLHHVNPVYPDTMRDAGRGGTVPIEALIGQDGSVLSARVLGAAVHPDFATSALDAVRQWQFSPTLLNGVPVEVVMKVTVSFTIE
jgi:TonB family protein